MKYILAILIPLILTSCSPPVDGLWIEANGTGYLRFYKDSVVINNFQLSWDNDTIGFRITADSITWIELDPSSNYGKTENSFHYRVNGDSLQIAFGPENRFRPENRVLFLKTRANNFHEYFATKGNLKLELPSAENVKRTLRYHVPLNIRIGFRDEKVIMFVDDIETNVNELEQAIKSVISRDELNEHWSDFTCQLFIDKNVTCDYTFQVFEALRANNIRRINFITKADQANPNTSVFWGLILWIPNEKTEH